ncbi:MAG: hypothetical protein RR740_00640 [Pseudomonas sp.]
MTDKIVFDEMAAFIENQTPVLTIWFLLYGGDSEDGRGMPVYKGRTISPEVALTFYRANIKNNPYSTGNVSLVGDKEIRHCTEKQLQAMIQVREKAGKAMMSQKRRDTQKKVPVTQKPAGYGSFA